MSLTPQFLDELRARTTLSTLIGRTVKVQKAGREFKACCPFHNEKTPSFTINDEKGFYHCFGCGAHGDAIRWMTDQRGLPFMDAVKELAQAASMEVPAADPRAAERAERANSLYDVMTAAAEWFCEQLQGIEGAAARDYLVKRGLSEATIKTFSVGFAPDSKSKLKAALKRFGDERLVEAGLLISVEDKEPYDRFRGRIMIPIRDPRGRVIAFGGRILGEGEPKYLNSPDTPLFDKGRTLYNLDLAAPASRKSGRAIVVEGYMDVIGLAQAGIGDAVAPLGTALTEHQIERLWRIVDDPIICFDGDPAGQKAASRAALRALPVLGNGKTLQFVALPDGQDPDDLVKIADGAVFKALLLRSRTLVDQIWLTEVERGPLVTPESRAALKQRLFELTASIRDGLVRSEYKSALLDRFWETFGWKKREIGQVRQSIAMSRTSGQAKGGHVLMRAILLGLSRYPGVLHRHFERVQALHVDDPYLSRWRSLLIDAAIERPTLDEDLIDTILAQSDVSPVEKRDLTKDLGFSFVFRRHDTEDRAEKDLQNVIDASIALRSFEFELEAAETRLKAATETEEWLELQRIRNAKAAEAERISALASWADGLEEPGIDRLHG